MELYRAVGFIVVISMRILYGVQGTGNGHLTRARTLTPALRKAGIEIDFLFSGRKREDYFDMEAFGDFDCRRGLTFKVRNGEIDTLQTLLANNAPRLVADIHSLDLSAYDLVLSDFEPVTAWAARLQSKTCISLSHQCAFDFAVPKVRGYFPSRLLMKYFAPANIRLGFHYYHFNQPILPPLIRYQTSNEFRLDKILVYMGFEELEDVIRFLKPFKDYEFVIFAKVDSRQNHGHISVNPISQTEFHEHLKDAGGVISNAGFALSSECLAMGKKLLVKPLSGQFEQLSNGLALQSLERATVTAELDQNILMDWLLLGPHKAIPYPDIAPAVAKWLIHDSEHNIQKLSQSIWNDVNFPYDYDDDFGSCLVPRMLY